MNGHASIGCTTGNCERDAIAYVDGFANCWFHLLPAVLESIRIDGHSARINYVDDEPIVLTRRDGSDRWLKWADDSELQLAHRLADSFGVLVDTI